VRLDLPLQYIPSSCPARLDSRQITDGPSLISSACSPGFIRCSDLCYEATVCPTGTVPQRKRTVQERSRFACRQPLTACPVSHFVAGSVAAFGGGFECVDTTSNIESCASPFLCLHRNVAEAETEAPPPLPRRFSKAAAASSPSRATSPAKTARPSPTSPTLPAIAVGASLARAWPASNRRPTRAHARQRVASAQPGSRSRASGKPAGAEDDALSVTLGLPGSLPTLHPRTLSFSIS
jgi:hypothetical protein